MPDELPLCGLGYSRLLRYHRGNRMDIVPSARIGWLR